MNAHTPFDANQDWTNPYCQNSSNDPMVDALLGNAYHVVRTVYCNLGNLKLIYDFLNQYGMVLGVQSESELKALTTKATFARIYDKSPAGDRRVTDYLYVEGDRTGILPDDTTATGSWVKVATSGSSGGGESSGEGAYIPWVFNNGAAVGGETTIRVPDGTLGVPFIIVNGYMNYVGKGFEFDTATLTITLPQPLEVGDEVVCLLTGVPAVPGVPNISNWTQINWLYNNGAAVGGEQVIEVPYTFQDIPAVFKNGLRLVKGLTTDSYTLDTDNKRFILTEPLVTNDRLVAQIGGEVQVLSVPDHTLEEVARVANVKDSEVILSTDTVQSLNGKKVIYSVNEQKSYGLPVLPTNVYVQSVANGKLTYNPGSVVVDLGAYAAGRDEFFLTRYSFADGFTLNTQDEQVIYNGDKYHWEGAFPKVVAAASTPDSTGGVVDGAWVLDSVTKLVKEKVQPFITAINPQDSEASLEESITDTRQSVLLESISTADTILVPSYYKLSGIGFGAYRADRTSFKSISKTGNAKHNFVNEDKTSELRDAVIGVDPTWFDGRWPQQTQFTNLAITGDRISNNEVGIFVFQGSGYKIDNTYISGCNNGILFSDVWVSEVVNTQVLDGAFTSLRGTSQRWSGCWSSGHASIIGAYHFKDTTYTTLTSCASDHAPRTAYFFEGGSEVTMVGCGTEFPSNDIDTALGTMIALNGSNKVTVIGFKGVPNAAQTTPLISVGDNDTLHLINWNSYQASYQNVIDISINGDGSTIIIEDGEFSGAATGNTAFPRVQFRGNYTKSRVILKYKNNAYIYTCPTGGGFVTAPERMFTKASVVPTLLVNNAATTGITYSGQSGYFTKNGNEVTFHFDIAVSAITGVATSATIKVSLTELPSTIIPGAISTGSLLVTGASSFTGGCSYITASNRYAYLYSSAGAELTGANVIAGTRIRGSISFVQSGSGWE